MRSAPLQRTDFQNRLAYFGGAITGNPSAAGNNYQDLEQFVVDATQMMSYDIRVTQCFLNWLTRYGVLLCPSKIRRLIKNGNYDRSIFGVFLSYLIENDPRPKRWFILKKYAKKKNKEELLFPCLPAPKDKANENFQKYGVLAHTMTPNPSKYLLPPEAVLKQCLELAHRAMMIGTVASDLLSLVKKNSIPKTVYEISKMINHHKAQVYAIVKTMERVGLRIL